jgi:transcriptional regulator with XRE-family HTH domain
MSEILKRYRDSEKTSVEALAEAIGVDRTTIWRWEKGRVPISRLSDVERVTGISRRDLRPDIFEDVA